MVDKNFKWGPQVKWNPKTLNGCSTITILFDSQPWKRMDLSPKYLDKKEVNGAPSIVLDFTRDGERETYWFRMEDGLLIQQSRPAMDGTNVTELLEQYIPFGNLGPQNYSNQNLHRQWPNHDDSHRRGHVQSRVYRQRILSSRP